jgi:ATP-dependent protease ClpP protease subunit
MPIRIFAAAAKRAEILIHESIGENWYGDGLTSKRFIKDLEDLGDVDTIVVRINSPGGAVFDGIAIYNALKAHKAKKEVVVEGLAASAASFIAMVGNTIRMGEGAMMMVHNPWTFAMGDANDMRDVADMLDQVGESLIDIYESRTKLGRDELKELLDAETWLTAKQAIEKGFADSTDEPEKEEDEAEAAASAVRERHRAAFKDFAQRSQQAANRTTLRIAAEIFQSAPADASTLEASMPNAAPASVQNTDKTPEQIAAEASAKALAAEKDRTSGIRLAFGRFSDEHRTLLDECLADQSCTVDVARSKLLAKLGEQHQPLGPSSHIVLGADARDRFRNGASKAILARAGMEKDEGGNEFRGMSLIALASHALNLAGINTRGLTAREVASKVFATHSTSDFPYLLSNTAGKALLRGYDNFPRTWDRWCAVRPVSDFKQVSNIQLGTFSSLATIPEGSEYTAGTIGEARETNQARTKGKKIAFTRQMLVNDDLGAFVGFSQKMGTAAARTVNADAYSVLNTNAALSDSVALFHASHSNLAGSGGAIGTTTISAAKAAMRKQRDSNANEYLNIMPKYLLVPVAIEDTALEFMTSTTKPTATASGVSNIHRNSMDVISDPTLDATSATAWYTVADPSIVELVQAVFLDGVQTPFIDEQVNFQTDALEMKVRLDYGFAAVDYRAGYKNAGA